jgi:2-haloacid dehalogenase
MAKLSDFKVLTFDVYGTLIDWEMGILDNLEPVLASSSFSREELLNVIHECESAQQVSPLSHFPFSPMYFRRLRMCLGPRLRFLLVHMLAFS